MIFQRSVGLSYTLQCPFACAHCITSSSPRNRERMQLEDALRYVRELQGVVDAVCFTGGEVFIHYADLLKLIEEANRCGLFSSAMTNAFWAKDGMGTRTTVNELKRAGLGSLGISLDTFHGNFIREERVLAAARAAAEVGIEASVRVIEQCGHNYSRRIQAALSSSNIKVESRPVTRFGRAAVELKEGDFPSLELKKLGPCDTVTLANVLPSGEVTACCGPGIYMADGNPLVLGNAREEQLSVILRRSRENKFMMMISLCGPAGLYRTLPRQIRSRIDGGPYPDYCSLCLLITNTPEYVHIIKARLAAEGASVKLAAAMLLCDVNEHSSGQCEMRPPVRDTHV